MSKAGGKVVDIGVAIEEDEIALVERNDADESTLKLLSGGGACFAQDLPEVMAEPADVERLLGAEEDIERDLNSWLEDGVGGIDIGDLNESAYAAEVDDVLVTPPALIGPIDYPGDESRVLTAAVGGFFILFVTAMVSGGLLLYDLQSQVESTRGNLQSLKTQLFGDGRRQSGKQGSPLLAPLLPEKSKNQTLSDSEVVSLRQELTVVNSKVSSMEKFLQRLKRDASSAPVPTPEPAVKSKSAATSVLPASMAASSSSKAGSKVTWAVNLAAFDQLSQLKIVQDKFRRNGFVAESQSVRVQGKRWYRLYVGGFSTKQAADTYAEKARELLGLNDVWVVRVTGRRP